jgi:hypothetical protein
LLHNSFTPSATPIWIAKVEIAEELRGQDDAIATPLTHGEIVANDFF